MVLCVNVSTQAVWRVLRKEVAEGFGLRVECGCGSLEVCNPGEELNDAVRRWSSEMRRLIAEDGVWVKSFEEVERRV